jgi:hypothetical protein
MRIDLSLVPSDGTPHDPLLLFLLRLIEPLVKNRTGPLPKSAQDELADSLLRSMREAAEANPAHRARNDELMHTPEGHTELTEQMHELERRIREIVARIVGYGGTLSARVIDSDTPTDE